MSNLNVDDMDLAYNIKLIHAFFEAHPQVYEKFLDFKENSIKNEIPSSSHQRNSSNGSQSPDGVLHHHDTEHTSEALRGQTSTKRSSTVPARNETFSDAPRSTNDAMMPSLQDTKHAIKAVDNLSPTQRPTTTTEVKEGKHRKRYQLPQYLEVLRTIKKDASRQHARYPTKENKLRHQVLERTFKHLVDGYHKRMTEWELKRISRQNDEENFHLGTPRKPETFDDPTSTDNAQSLEDPKHIEVFEDLSPSQQPTATTEGKVRKYRKRYQLPEDLDVFRRMKNAAYREYAKYPTEDNKLRFRAFTRSLKCLVYEFHERMAEIELNGNMQAMTL